MAQFVISTLKLPANMDLPDFEIGVRPGEPEHFTPPEAENEDEDVCGIEGIAVGACRFRISAAWWADQLCRCGFLGTGSRTTAAMFRLMSSSATALLRAARSVSRTSLMVRPPRT